MLAVTTCTYTYKSNMLPVLSFQSLLDSSAYYCSCNFFFQALTLANCYHQKRKRGREQLLEYLGILPLKPLKEYTNMVST